MAGALSGDTELEENNYGALSAYDSEDPSDYAAITASSPQEMRNLQALAFTKGMLAPTHSGAPLLEGYANVANNEYQIYADQIKQNQALRAKLAAIAASKNMQRDIVREQIAGRERVAKLVSGKGQQYLLSPEEIDAMGLPPGTVATKNSQGKIDVVSKPPVSQQMLVGYDEEGRPQYANPGAALTPAVRTNIQTYLRQANQITPQLNQLIADLETGEMGGALGASGLGERIMESTAGQVKGLFGGTEPIAPEHSNFRARLKQFNELALPTLEADPRHQALGQKARERVSSLLPSPESWGQSAPDALEKLKTLRDQINSRTVEYNDMLRGKGLVERDYQDDPREDDAELPTPPTPSQTKERLNRELIIQHAREAIAKGKNPSAVAKAAKERYGIDINEAVK